MKWRSAGTRINSLPRLLYFSKIILPFLAVLNLWNVFFSSDGLSAFSDCDVVVLDRCDRGGDTGGFLGPTIRGRSWGATGSTLVLGIVVSIVYLNQWIWFKCPIVFVNDSRLPIHWSQAPNNSGSDITIGILYIKLYSFFLRTTFFCKSVVPGGHSLR